MSQCILVSSSHLLTVTQVKSHVHRTGFHLVSYFPSSIDKSCTPSDPECLDMQADIFHFQVKLSSPYHTTPMFTPTSPEGQKWQKWHQLLSVSETLSQSMDIPTFFSDYKIV